MNRKLLQPLIDSNQLEVFRKQVEKVVIALPGPDDIWMIKQPGWIAVPCESTDHLDENEWVRLQRIVSALGYQNIVGVALESVCEGTELGTFVPTTVDAIEEFDSLYSFYWCALYAGEPDWIILCTKLDYFVVAGPENFVREFLGCEFSKAFDRFYEYLSSETYMPQKEHMMDVYQHLQNDYPKAKPGEIVVLREHV